MQHFITYARNERNADYADAEAEKEFKNAVLNFKFESVDEHGIDNGKKQNRYRHHKEKIIRSAARMQPAVFFRAGGNKFILRFIAGNCFMLRTVIHKKPLHVFYAGTAEKITDINSHAQYTLDERTPKALCLPENHRRNQLRKKHKKPDSKRNAKHKRNCYCDFFNGFSESFRKPFFEFCRFLIRKRIFAVHFCGIHRCGHACCERFNKRNNSANYRQPPKSALLRF